MLYIILMCISHLMFFANGFLLAVYFIFILVYGNDVDKKQIGAIFLFKFKMGPKGMEATCSLNNTFGSGTANEHIVQLWFKKFGKGKESLEDEEHSGRPLEVDDDQLRAIVKANLPITT